MVAGPSIHHYRDRRRFVHCRRQSPSATDQKQAASSALPVESRTDRGIEGGGEREGGSDRASESVRQTDPAAAESGVVNVCMCARLCLSPSVGVCTRGVRGVPARRRGRRRRRVACKKRQSDHKERRASEQGEGEIEREAPAREGGSGRSDGVCRSVYVRMCGGEEQSCLFVRSSLRAADADSNDDDDDEAFPGDRPPRLESKMSPQPVGRPPFLRVWAIAIDGRTGRYLAIVSGETQIDVFLGPTCGRLGLRRPSFADCLDCATVDRPARSPTPRLIRARK